MGKKSSIFMLKKSSKRYFNFYEDYSILGSTFNYTKYFKYNFFFNYWLKFTLQKIGLFPIDIFYSKSLGKLYIFILVNKKYLLFNTDFVNLYKYKLESSFTKKKFLSLLRWLKVNKSFYYNKNKGILFYDNKYSVLEKCVFKLKIRKINFNFFLMGYFFKLRKFFLKIVFYLFIYLSNLKSKGGWFNIFKFKIIKLKFFVFFLKILNFFLVKEKGLKSKIIKCFFFSFNKGSYLKKINKFRWYFIKNYLINLVNKKFLEKSSFFFLNFNDYNVLYNNVLSNRSLNKVINNCNLGNIKKLQYFREIILFKLHILNVVFLKKIKKIVNTFLIFFKKTTFKNMQFNPLIFFLEMFLIFIFLYSFYILYLFFYKVLVKKKVIFYYFGVLNFFYIVKSNIFWNRNLKRFYKDIKKSCKYFTTNEKFFKKIVTSMFFSLLITNPLIFSTTIADCFSSTRKHYYFLNNVEDIVKSSFKFIKKYKKIELKSITIKIKGKFNGSLKRGNKEIMVGDKIKLQNISNNIKYAFSEAHTFAGSFGIKVWYNF